MLRNWSKGCNALVGVWAEHFSARPRRSCTRVPGWPTVPLINPGPRLETL